MTVAATPLIKSRRLMLGHFLAVGMSSDAGKVIRFSTLPDDFSVAQGVSIQKTCWIHGLHKIFIGGGKSGAMTKRVPITL
ncbi:hypothetical protein AA23498_0030 [Acetobacter nitrogenifigens DSM 23921 = NBRC 105050]|nr:hypothetical protein AA23498_0030 [Acetobacter nitrogenifigens DSM 23921 = NBRC 105050]